MYKNEEEIIIKGTMNEELTPEEYDELLDILMQFGIMNIEIINKWRFQREVKTLTNEQKIRNKISTIEGLADYLVSYNDDYGEFYTSDCESFETKCEAVQHEIEWLKEEYNELW